MFNVGGGELLVIALIALIVLGPQRLPEAMRTVGKVMGEVRRVSSGFQQEMKDAFTDLDADKPRTRREAVPLARAVADVEADTHEGDVGDDAPAVATSPWGDDDPVAAASLSPAVADALDEIVTPLTPPAPGATPAEPPASSDGVVGDERAAS
jgi:sec-independent protein translocase protein TatB